MKWILDSGRASLGFGLVLLLGVGWAGSAARAQSPGPWKMLFNGKDLSGWTVAAGRGGGAGAPGGTAAPAGAAAPAPAPAPAASTWKVVDGVLVGGDGGGRGGGLNSDE